MSNNRNLVLSALDKYKTDYSSEEGFISEMSDFIKANDNCFERSNLKGHINGGAWVLNPQGDKVLLTHHKKLNRWLQLGGHADGDFDVWNVALREATEESGIDGIKFVSKEIFDIDNHDIPENLKKGEPAHKHYEVRFLMQAPTEDFIVSEESNSLKWVSYDELMNMGDAVSIALGRMADKWKKWQDKR